jgi:hypothetical protein
MNEQEYNKQLSETIDAITSQDILDKYGITEYTVDDLVRDFEDSYAYKVEQARIFKILDAADHSDIWKTYNRKIPNYVQTPTHNPITIIKEATKASIMPTSFQGEFRALTLEAREVADICNKYFAMKWLASGMDQVNDECADYAFLLGTSGVLFGWNENIIDYADISNYFNPSKHVQFQAKAWHPSNIFPDPTAESVEEMSYIYFVERKSKKFLKTIARFQQAMYAIDNANDVYGNINTNITPDPSKKTMPDTVTFITCYKRVNRVSKNPSTGEVSITPKVDVIYMAGKNILDISPNIEPNIIPFVPLYDEKMPNNFWGISKCYKVLSMVIALNQLDSIEATHYFKNQNPAEFINALAGLNVANYQNKRDNPDAAFTVNCDPKLVQAFAQRPDLPKTIDGFRQYLLECIANVSGVDAAYLGRSYGSIQTTGGVEQSIDRATMRDNNRIKNIDKFIRKEIEIMCQFYMAHGKVEEFYPQKNSILHEQSGTAEQALQFDPQALIAREDISIDVTNAAPRSNQSFEDAAMQLMELQMKYDPAAHGYADFITPEELINWMNIPRSQKYLIAERMRAQQENMKLEEYTAVISAFGQLVDGGMDPQQALMEVAKQIEASKLGQLPAVSGMGAQNINGQIPPTQQ